MPIEQKACRLLELDKILQMLVPLTCCDYAAEQALALHPSTDYKEVQQRLKQTDDAFVLSAKFGTPRFLKLLPPQQVLRVAERGGLLSMTQLLGIAAILKQARMLHDWYAMGAQQESSLQPLFSGLQLEKALEKQISSTIIGEDQIDDHASEQLFYIRQSMRKAQDKAKKSIDGIVRASKYQKALQEAIITQRGGRFVLPVKAEYKSEIPGLVHDTSHSGATLFIEPMAVVEANNEIRMLEQKEAEEIERILYVLSGLCAESADAISCDFERSIELNLAFAKANLGAMMRASKPQIIENGEVVLKKARHPLIGKDTVVPIEVAFGQKFHTLLITGPNTGGKTVTLKTIGLLTLMTMCGLLIPAGEGSVISIFEHILVDIGDEQSIEQSLSTFSSHMSNLISMLQTASSTSLVLADELGSGTDPVEGAALAISILEAFHEKGAMIAASTHYPELKVYALETDGVENASCEFDVKTLMPTYRLLMGVPGRSNAFAISQKLGLSQAILQRATRRVSDQDKQLEHALEQLAKTRQEAEQQQLLHQQKVAQYQSLLLELEQKHKALDASQQKILDTASQQARRMVEQVQSQSYALVEELELLRKQKDKEDFTKLAGSAKSQLKGKLDRLADIADPIERRRLQHQQDYKLPRKLKAGDDVLVVDLDKKATLVEAPTKSGTVLLQVGMMRMRAEVENLRLIEHKNPYAQPQAKYRSTTKQTNITKSATMELDLRGLMVEEALHETDLFLDKSVLSGILQVTLIHGKGTGALRKAIHLHLKKHRSVAEYRLGLYGEGESGVTVATLK